MRSSPARANLDLSRHLRGTGLALRPRSLEPQQVCSIGGNVATNSAGPRCLAYGVTSAHVLAADVVLPDGDTVRLGGLQPQPPGYDLRGAFVGSEGTLGVATAIAVRLTLDPPEVRTLLVDFADVSAAAATVSGIIAAGVVPAALEMMDAPITRAVEEFVHAGFPVDAAAVLLVEIMADSRTAVARQVEILPVRWHRSRGRARSARATRTSVAGGGRAARAPSGPWPG
ncbi:MAG: FAD-linked oxidase C-terminal domain-containing protein [Acidimicrobiia bacterium]|nr:FAD-linked oxidase C-terminal domain-containing protein [Acidimicrobiia bacterium]